MSEPNVCTDPATGEEQVGSDRMIERREPFDPNTDSRLAGLHQRLARARDPEAPILERVGLYGRLADEVGGYRAGTRGNQSFTPREADRLATFRCELVTERRTLLDGR